LISPFKLASLPGTLETIWFLSSQLPAAKPIVLPFPPHYRNRVLCRVSKTLGKGYFTLGKGFAEYNTRQRTLGKDFIGKGFFAECFFSDTRQRLCRVSKNTRQRKTLGKLRIEKF
jgi:hypothetical protein